MRRQHGTAGGQLMDEEQVAAAAAWWWARVAREQVAGQARTALHSGLPDTCWSPLGMITEQQQQPR